MPAILTLLGIAVLLAIIPPLGHKKTASWRPPIFSALLLWFIFGNVLPYAMGPSEDYQRNYVLGCILIPVTVFGADYIRFRFTEPFFERRFKKK
jgi:hypothetical protein